ncbi:reverse transcriptase [Corchorus capsularis]|uniref:Reverse transcriptase n=1 Tax=Corchorus capsularis TaxID=210143 RepID=A0A1R3IUV0_COCAP|nr:reverse transcriptase [Corchorus capsularis]
MSSENSLPPISCEEEAELHRSTKKIKENNSMSNQTQLPPRSVVSYKDSLLGANYGLFDQSHFLDHEDSEMGNNSDEDPDVDTRSTKLHSLWNLPQRFFTIDLGCDYFLVKFDSDEDYNSVLKGVWLRLPELPIEYYDLPILKRIGKRIGQVLRIDNHTLSSERGKYARLCVQVNLEKPLPTTVTMEGEKQAIIYESIGMLCFNCGKLGHRKSSCPDLPISETTQEKPVHHPSEKAPSPKDGDEYDPWLLVQRRRSKNKVPTTSILTADTSHNKKTIASRSNDRTADTQFQRKYVVKSHHPKSNKEKLPVAEALFQNPPPHIDTKSKSSSSLHIKEKSPKSSPSVTAKDTSPKPSQPRIYSNKNFTPSGIFFTPLASHEHSPMQDPISSIVLSPPKTPFYLARPIPLPLSFPRNPIYLLAPTALHHLSTMTNRWISSFPHRPSAPQTINHLPLRPRRLSSEMRRAILEGSSTLDLNGLPLRETGAEPAPVAPAPPTREIRIRDTRVTRDPHPSPLTPLLIIPPPVQISLIPNSSLLKTLSRANYSPPINPFLMETCIMNIHQFHLTNKPVELHLPSTQMSALKISICTQVHHLRLATRTLLTQDQEVQNEVTLTPWLTSPMERSRDPGWVMSEQIPSLNPISSTMLPFNKWKIPTLLATLEVSGCCGTQLLSPSILSALLNKRYIPPLRDVYDNIFHRKKRILARLAGVQKAIDVSLNQFLLDLQKSLTFDYQQILKDEWELWALKSILNWILEGERNSRFFHVTTLIRRRFNKIMGLSNDNGDWISDPLDLQQLVLSYFKNLFSTTNIAEHLSFDSFNEDWASLLPEDLAALNIPLTDVEIHKTLWTFKPDKAPGPDGLHPGFYQRNWATVKSKICSAIHDIFYSASMPPEFNGTLISLIPKCHGLTNLSQFRPISLCNTIYKLVTNILVLRLRPFLNKLICPLQSSFIPGRQGIDNVVIVQELIHTMKKTKGARGWMAIKIDLEKAFEKLEWGFIRKVLSSYNFPANWQKLIMSCITTTNTSILINGGKLESFTPSRGFPIHHDCPSKDDYLFILDKHRPSCSLASSCSHYSISTSPTGSDILCWNFSPNGNFTLSSAYRLALNLDPCPSFVSNWSWIWKLKCLPKLQYFVWECFHSILSTKLFLHSRKLTLDTSCHNCPGAIETIEHVLRSCQLAQTFWRSLPCPPALKHLSNAPFHDWVTGNLRSKLPFCRHNVPWSFIFIYAIWELWLLRNAAIFKNSSPNPKAAESAIFKDVEFYAMAGFKCKSLSPVFVPVKWHPPQIGWFKLNSDGSFIGNPGRGGVGAIIHNHEGNWVTGSHRSIGIVSSVEAELWALRDGLNWLNKKI